MNVITLSNNFDTLIQAYAISKNNILNFDEYEKSVFLTKAQNEIVRSLYNGVNPRGESFESIEEFRRYLEPLIVDKNVNVNNTDTDSSNININKYKTFNLSNNFKDLKIIGIVFEEAKLISNDNECINNKIVSVVPVRHDEITRITANPFRGPNENRVLRVDYGTNQVQLLSKYDIEYYHVRYIKEPVPIVLVDLDTGLSVNERTNITGNEELLFSDRIYDMILDRAVQMAVQSRIKSNNNAQ